jgi:hexosaminidase
VALKVSAMFDTPYVHIGGDEVPQNAWTNCSHCQALIRSAQLKDLVGLQQYFERKMAAFLSAQGKQAIYWGVDLERGIPPGMVVQGWHPGESLTAIRMGFRSINSDCRGTYLDFPAGPGDLGEGVS